MATSFDACALTAGRAAVAVELNRRVVNRPGPNRAELERLRTGDSDIDVARFARDTVWYALFSGSFAPEGCTSEVTSYGPGAVAVVLERWAMRSRRARDAAELALVHGPQRHPLLYPDRVPCVMSEPSETTTGDVVDELSGRLLGDPPNCGWQITQMVTGLAAGTARRCLRAPSRSTFRAYEIELHHRTIIKTTGSASSLSMRECERRSVVRHATNGR